VVRGQPGQKLVRSYLKKKKRKRKEKSQLLGRWEVEGSQFKVSLSKVTKTLSEKQTKSKRVRGSRGKSTCKLEVLILILSTAILNFAKISRNSLSI
jgi:hypothetical protein